MSGWGIFLVFLVLWNGPCKLPFYIMDQHHVPASPLLGFISGGKYRAALMRSDPIFFLVIHTVMGCVLLGLWAALFLAPVTILGNRSLQVFFFLLAFVFALHILPETTGLPNRLFAKPINEVAIFIVLVGVFVGLLGCALDNEGMIVAGFNTTGSMSVVAPVLEIMEIVANVGVYLKTGVARDVDKNRDVGFNQSGWYKFRTKYTKMKCPFAPVTSATQV